MIWIVNILATMMYLGFGVIYTAGFPKRKHFGYSMTVTVAAIFLAQIGMSFCFRQRTILELRCGWYPDMYWY